MYAPTCVQYLSGVHSLCHSGNGIREWSGNRCMFAIPRQFPFPFPFPPNSLGVGGGSITPVTIFPPKKETEQVVRNRMEEQTARDKQAEAWG